MSDPVMTGNSTQSARRQSKLMVLMMVSLM